jgi:hypothetical protein
MAGSLNHIIGEDGKFTMGGIDNLGDAHEALDECFKIIYHLTGGYKGKVNMVCIKYSLPTIKVNMVLGGDEAL